MKIILLISLMLILSCSEEKQTVNININPYVNHVSRIMLRPDLFVDMKIETFGVLYKSSGGQVMLLPDESFKELSFSLLIPHTISISSKTLEINKGFGNVLNRACLSQVVEVSGFFRKGVSNSYYIEPDIISKAVTDDIKNKDCFVRKEQ